MDSLEEALILASDIGNVELVKSILVDSDLDINAINVALKYAAHKGFADVVEVTGWRL
jgi:hypothetical protein